MELCMACRKAAATESCLLCRKRVCKADFAGNGLCMGCAGGRKIIGYFSNIEWEKAAGEKTPESGQETLREPRKTTGSKRYIP